MNSTLSQLNTELTKTADKQKAKILQGFFKTGKGQYGEGDIFLGIVVPVQRQIAKKYSALLTLTDLDKLIKSKIHEERLVSLLILVEKFQESKNENQKLEIYSFYLKHSKFINNWDLVDLSAPKIVGVFLSKKNKKVLLSLARSENLWERRIAIVSTFYFITQGNPVETIKLSEVLLKDSHDLIHKATGWMLREVGKRCGEKYLENFLNTHYKKMPRTMLRYAIERLPKMKRLEYMKK